jgi:predicted DNA-binding transcriptional regulator AlpA
MSNPYNIKCNTNDGEADCFWPRRQLCEIVGLSYPCIWQLIRERDFPPARRISKNRVGWLKSEVIQWMRSRPAQSYKPEGV